MLGLWLLCGVVGGAGRAGLGGKWRPRASASWLRASDKWLMTSDNVWDRIVDRCSLGKFCEK